MNILGNVTFFQPPAKIVNMRVASVSVGHMEHIRKKKFKLD